MRILCHSIAVSFLLSLLFACVPSTISSSPPELGPEETLPLDAAVLATDKLSWSARSDYVGMNIPFAPIAAVKAEIEKRQAVTLKSRGEAHITVVTPQELTTLRTRLKLEQINGLMEKAALQTIKFQPQCLGRGQLKQDNRPLATYFIVVDAPGLLQVREKLRQQFVAAGGEKQAFAAELYYPHITVGFTDRDLHAADGVVKDKKSCVYKLE